MSRLDYIGKHFKPAIEHWEKLLVLAALVIAMAVVAGSRWQPYDRTPGDLIEEVAQAEARLLSADWPESERAHFGSIDGCQRAHALMAGIEVDEYTYSVPMTWPLTPQPLPVREPKLYRLVELIARPWRGVVAARPAKQPAPTAAPGPADRSEEPAVDQPALEPAPRGLPVRGVMLCGIADLKKQRQAIIAARWGRVGSREADLVRYEDFIVERQRAVAGMHPWREENWERLDIQDTFEILDLAERAELDPEHDPFRDPTVTMPPLKLLFGTWEGLSGHPRLGELKRSLSGDLNLDENAEGHIRGTVDGRRSGRRKFVWPGNPSRPAARRAPATHAKPRPQPPSLDGQLLLFRFADFTVEPGQAYLYRVRLVLSNPNYGLTNVVHPSVAQGRTRETQWSEPSNVAAIEPDAEFFLVDVKPKNGRTWPAALIEVFQWDSEVGTMVKATSETLIGQQIGGKADVRRLRPAAGRLDVEPVRFSTGHLLVDCVEPPRLAPAEHEDLQIDARWPRRRGEFGIPATMLVIDQCGRLVVRDEDSSQEKHEQVRQSVEDERAYFRDVLERNTEFAGLGSGR